MAFYVFDLDGTLADLAHRRSFLEAGDYRGFFAACGDDKPIEHVLALLRTLHAAGHKIEIWSGRSDECRDLTEAWLVRHDVPAGIPVIMRTAGDKRPDHIVKREFLRGTEAPDVIFDDRKVVVDMWRSKGLVCFQVAPGDF
jgi:phosphoglycolate phosphatase-like HAD superfamily hydrolase